MNDNIINYHIKYNNNLLDPYYLTFGDCRYDNVYIISKIFGGKIDIEKYILSRLNSLNFFVKINSDGELVDFDSIFDSEEYVQFYKIEDVSIAELQERIQKFGYAMVETISPLLPFSKDYSSDFSYMDYDKDYYSFIIVDYDEDYYYYIADMNLVNPHRCEKLCENNEIGKIKASIIEDVFRKKLDIIDFRINERFRAYEKIKNVLTGFFSQSKYDEYDEFKICYGNEAYKILEGYFENLKILGPSKLYPYKSVASFCLWKLNSLKFAYVQLLNWFNGIGEFKFSFALEEIINKYRETTSCLMKAYLLGKYEISLNNHIKEIRILDEKLKEGIAVWLVQNDINELSRRIKSENGDTTSKCE